MNDRKGDMGSSEMGIADESVIEQTWPMKKMLNSSIRRWAGRRIELIAQLR